MVGRTISNFLHTPQLDYSPDVHWGKVTIIGVGLLGGSIGLALKQRKLVGEVCGYVRRKSAVQDALRAGAVDRATNDVLEAVSGADLIIVCTPISRMEGMIAQMFPALRKGVVVTDVGSVKAPLVRALSSKIAKTGAHFIGSHPMAGSERGGVGSAHGGLFDGAVCVVTPTSRSPVAAVNKVRRFWNALGSQVLTMDARTHDKLVSRASHLPHLIAALLAGQVLDPRQDKRQAKLCATGFRDTTRVAASSPEMWCDIAMANRRNLIRDLTRFGHQIQSLCRWLAEKDANRVEQLLMNAQQLRGDWDHRKASNSQE
jgi:prephenate dehydrogenase